MELHPGTIVAERYEVLGPLGRGGMGELYTARNLRTERRVALKLLRADAKFRADAIERFRREARAAGMISSEYVTQVFDVEDDPNWGIAIIFELLEGESLLERLRRTGPMSPTVLHPVVSQILSGLAAAHAAGVIHRDLKPSNIFIVRRPDGSSVVKILDFGISKLPKGMTKNTLTEPGQSLGSFMFMPPEQIHGAGRVDARADIYAVGTLAFQALTGHLPFDSTNIVELVRLKSSTNPRTLAQVLGRPTSPELEAWLARALARDVGARFQSAQEAAQTWAQLAPHPSAAPPPMPTAEPLMPHAEPTSASPRSRPPPLPQHASSPSISPQALPPASPWGLSSAGPPSPVAGPFPGAAMGQASATPTPPPLNQVGPPPLGSSGPQGAFNPNASPAPFYPNAPPGGPAFNTGVVPFNAGGAPYNANAGAAPFGPNAGAAPFNPNANASPAPFSPNAGGAPFTPNVGGTPFPPNASPTPFAPNASSTPFPPNASPTPFPPNASPTPFNPSSGATVAFSANTGPAPFNPNASPAPFNPNASPAPFNPNVSPAPFYPNAAPGQASFGNATPPPFPAPPAAGSSGGPPPLPGGYGAPPPPPAQAPAPSYAPPPYALAPGLAPPNAPPPGWLQPQPQPYGGAAPSRRPLTSSPPIWAYGLVAVLIVVAVLVLMAVVYVRFG